MDRPIMNCNPLISVVIPAYNRQDTITYCLDSVVSQTYEKIEIIVVDDCSGDKTLSVVQSYPDSRVRCIIQDKNAGAQAARNRGIMDANGDWIAFQDSDDEWLPDKLEKQVAVLAESSFDQRSFVYGNAYRFDRSRDEKTLRLSRSVEGECPYAEMLLAPAPVFPTILASKKALEKIGYLDEKVPSFQEWDTAIQLARYCRFFHVKEPLMIYHVSNGDSISGNATRHVEGWRYIISKYEDDIRKLCGEATWLELNAQLLWRCLDLGLSDRYDRYKNADGKSQNFSSQLVYLNFCRQIRIRPNNILYRVFRKITGRTSSSFSGQGAIVKQT